MKNQVLIIAEAGVNHNGDLEMAKKMVYAAKKAGADYIKFQTAVPENVISVFAPKAEYQKENTKASESQLEMCKAIHLRLEDYSILKKLCDDVGIGFMSTPFDLVSIDCLSSLGMDYWKIPSGEITNLPYLRKIGALGERVIMSTGMSTLEEVEKAVNILETSGTKRSNIWLLHCTTQYPAPYNSVNLRAMDRLRTLGCAGVGYSDHTKGIEITVAAVALGAVIVEKHFTLDNTLKGPDHKASLEPKELAHLVSSVRHTYEALGNGNKEVAEAEIENINIARKSIVASCPIMVGEIFSEGNITTKRPGNGISPMLWDEVIGKTARRNFVADEPIEI